jgi:hypothetical protein
MDAAARELLVDFTPRELTLPSKRCFAARSETEPSEVNKFG